MSKGAWKKETKIQKLMEKAQELFPDVDISQINKQPDETVEDKMREAQSVLRFFETKGKDFIQEICWTCGEPFAYNYRFTGVKYCGIPCTARALEKAGLKWNPNKHPEERWGPSIPAVVPPEVFETWRKCIQMVESQEDQPLDTSV
jgi:hypothetical protein